MSAASGAFAVAEFTAKVHAMTGHTGYTTRQAAYDLRELRGKEVMTKMDVAAEAAASGPE